MPFWDIFIHISAISKFASPAGHQDGHGERLDAGRLKTADGRAGASKSILGAVSCLNTAASCLKLSNLGSPVTATGATLSATNLVTPGPQRFYRLVLSP
jgi:hypothetical protein